MVFAAPDAETIVRAIAQDDAQTKRVDVVSRADIFSPRFAEINIYIRNRAEMGHVSNSFKRS
ncbi:MAG: hypothetical protein CMM63_09485 [Rhodospirillaceae bacterium]|nr:hypothetical protein [Rhodospirillaceae bacterium]